jgi:hypothetical protein
MRLSNQQMNGEHMLRSILGALLLTMAAGCAVTPTPPRYAESTSTATSHCLTTGTRIVSRDDACTESGRSYTQDDLRRTGSTTVAGALQRLDPAITLRQ